MGKLSRRGFLAMGAAAAVAPALPPLLGPKTAAEVIWQKSLVIRAPELMGYYRGIPIIAHFDEFPFNDEVRLAR